MRWQVEPMPRWPYPETKGRKPNPFRAKFDATLDLLESELDHLGVQGAVAVRVVATEADVRRDGMLRARAHVRHPGVVVSFRSAIHGALSYPCDQFHGRFYAEADWHVNLRAIALGLEALRKLDRYGIAGKGEQYTGWRAIESGSVTVFRDSAAAISWLRDYAGVNGPLASLSPLLRTVAAMAHPDRHNGDRTLWDRYDAARQLLEREGRAS